MTEDELTGETYVVSQETGMDHTTLLACALAESGGNERAARWAYPGNNRTAVCEAYADANDVAGVQKEIDNIVANGSSDISFGLGQQTYRWSNEYVEWNKGWDAQAVMDFRLLYFDPDHALETMAAYLLPWYQQNGGNKLETLYRYNKPYGDPAPEAKANYQRALVHATELVAAFVPSEETEIEDGIGDIVVDENIPESVWESAWTAVFPAFYNPEAAFVKFWKENYGALGSPLSAEIPAPDDPGRIYQVFARGILRWTDKIDIVA